MDYKVYPTIRKDKKDTKGLAPLYIYILNGRKVVYKESLKHKIPEELWDNETRRVKRKYPNATLVNSIIEGKVLEISRRILENQVLKGSVTLPDIVNQQKAKDVCFFEFAERQIQEKNYAPETRRGYSVYLEKIKDYKKPLKLSDLNFEFLQGYEAHLRNVLKNEGNTVWGNMKFINTMVNDAIKMNYLNSNPFKTYQRPKYKQTPRAFLIQDELAKVEQFASETSNEGLRLVANYFLFMCYTGLRFSDALRFRKTLHVIAGERIVIETQKTKKVTNIYINEKIRGVLDYVDSNRLHITQVDFNRKLKVIAEVKAINKNLTSHVARHSFGSSLAFAGVPERVAQALLAHGNASSTKVYYHIQNASLDEAMKKLKY